MTEYKSLVYCFKCDKCGAEWIDETRQTWCEDCEQVVDHHSKFESWEEDEPFITNEPAC